MGHDRHPRRTGSPGSRSGSKRTRTRRIPLSSALISTRATARCRTCALPPRRTKHAAGREVKRPRATPLSPSTPAKRIRTIAPPGSTAYMLRVHSLCRARMPTHDAPIWHGTTILTVRKGGKVAIGGDGQVTLGQTIVKAQCPQGAPARQGRRHRRLRRRDRGCLHAVRAARSQARAISRPAHARLRSSSPRTGAPTAICAGWRR